jgi:predicted nuclease of predicted toxin-antitoxin system
VIDPILIDECLSPRSAAVARARGLEAMHVTWLELNGAGDWDVAGFAAERNYVVATKQAA